MLVKHAIETPASTEQAAPLVTTITMPPGKVTRVSIEFPAGCAGLVGARVLQGTFQLWPLTPGEWFVTDDFVIDFPEDRDLTPGMTEFDVETYNTDTVNEHTVSFRFAVVQARPDPLQQVAEIMEHIAGSIQPVPAPADITTSQVLADVRELLFLIHASDLPAIYSALTQQRR